MTDELENAAGEAADKVQIHAYISREAKEQAQLLARREGVSLARMIEKGLRVMSRWQASDERTLQLLIDYGGAAHSFCYLKDGIGELGEAERESLRRAVESLESALDVLGEGIERAHDAAYGWDGEER